VVLSREISQKSEGTAKMYRKSETLQDLQIINAKAAAKF
jgi:hypothetical protein